VNAHRHSVAAAPYLPLQPVRLRRSSSLRVLQHLRPRGLLRSLT
jgi:hypothetical protein